MRLLFVWFVLLAGCGPADAPVSAPPVARVQPVLSSPATGFDLPALAEHPIDEVVATLRPFLTKDTEPTPADVRAGVVEWAKQFRRDTLTLRVTYDVHTRQVLDFFLASTNGPIPDYGPLLALGHVPARDPRWHIEPFALPGRPGLYLGVHVARD
ncbi:hypothetical protein GCM10027511_22440 [Hymenobacter humi]